MFYCIIDHGADLLSTLKVASGQSFGETTEFSQNKERLPEADSGVEDAF